MFFSLRAKAQRGHQVDHVAQVVAGGGGVVVDLPSGAPFWILGAAQLSQRKGSARMKLQVMPSSSVSAALSCSCASRCFRNSSQDDYSV